MIKLYYISKYWTQLTHGRASLMAGQFGLPPDSSSSSSWHVLSLQLPSPRRRPPSRRSALGFHRSSAMAMELSRPNLAWLPPLSSATATSSHPHRPADLPSPPNPFSSKVTGVEEEERREAHRVREDERERGETRWNPNSQIQDEEDPPRPAPPAPKPTAAAGTDRRVGKEPEPAAAWGEKETRARGEGVRMWGGGRAVATLP
jgi:hypothetical protein